MSTLNPPVYPFGGYEQRPGLDLPPEYRQLQTQAPVTALPTVEGDEIFLVTGFPLVRQVLSRPEDFSREHATIADDLRAEPYLPDIEGTRHKALRALIQPCFTPTRAEQLRPRATQITDDLLDRMERTGSPADLVAHLALPLPVTIISEILGVAVADRERFGTWATAFLGLRPTATPAELHAAATAQTELHAFFKEQLTVRASADDDSVLSVLATAEAPDPDVQMLQDDRIRLAIAVLVAGFETTTSMITSMVYWLLYRHPAIWSHLHHHPHEIPGAVDELLRLIPSDARDGMARGTTRDVELGGVHLPAGSNVLVAKAAANRDPCAFSDPAKFNPERFSREQRSPRHLTFGYGPHTCPGAHLARVELQVALTRLLTRFPTMRPAIPETELTWKRSTMRGLQSLPVRWD